MNLIYKIETGATALEASKFGSFDLNNDSFDSR